MKIVLGDYMKIAISRWGFFWCWKWVFFAARWDSLPIYRVSPKWYVWGKGRAVHASWGQQ